MKLIDADKLIEDIEIACNLSEYGLYEEHIVEIIEKQPEVKVNVDFKFRFKSDSLEIIPYQKWIPCSEKLPEEEGKYLCDIGSGDYAVGNYTKEYGWIFKHYVKECNAWQPLPPKFEG